MKYVELQRFGTPSEVCRLVDGPEPDGPGADEVMVEMHACPINPAELLLIEGRYASRPALPARLGIEGAGHVVAVGSNVSDIAPGDRVMSLGRQNWAERVCLAADAVIKLPAGGDMLQLGMLKVNPATAFLMLRSYVDLRPGNWVIQNAANSAVGRVLIQLAKAEGIGTVNVVRRESLIAPLKALGADVVIVDGDALADRVAAESGGGAIRLAIDAVAGAATRRLADCVADGGTVVNYGLLSGEPCHVTPEQLVFRGITLTGFWLAKRMREMSRSELEAMYAELGEKISKGALQMPVQATYTFDQLAEALGHAGREQREGKVLLTPVPRHA